ncbi:MAG: S41 family peptidase [Peptococcaceae bacterium]|nr:S41 family peptidase [Peptococcaceae bacterium]
MGVFVAANYKHVSNLVKVIAIVRTQYLQPVNSDQMIDGAIKGIVDSLNDPYSVYLEPKTFAMLQEQIKGSFGGLGILVGVKDSGLTVVRAYEGTPAAKAGIEAGDQIIRINDTDARGMDLETAVGLMRGPVGSTISLTIERRGGTLQFSNIAREEISVPTVEGQVIGNSDIGYIMISQFTERSPEEMGKVLSNLQSNEIKGLILDLRDNPGGELTSAVNVAKHFIPKGPIVFIDYRNGRDQEFPSEGQTVDLPLVVLINEGSASAAEILAGAVKDTGVGTLIGTKTFGKGVVQTLFQLDNGAGLKLTTAKYLTPNRNDINLKGIEPDVSISNQDPPHDSQLDRAVEIMKQKIAS